MKRVTVLILTRSALLCKCDRASPSNCWSRISGMDAAWCASLVFVVFCSKVDGRLRKNGSFEARRRSHDGRSI